MLEMTFPCGNERCGAWALAVAHGVDVIREDLEAVLLGRGWLILLTGCDTKCYCSRRCLEVDVVGY